MARYPQETRQRIDSAIDLFKERCLLDDRSLTVPNRAGVWTGGQARDLYERFTRTTDSRMHFDEQWKDQLADASVDLKLFAAELLLVHFLFASSVSAKRKREVVAQSLAETDLEIPKDSTAWEALEDRIGHPGIGFNARRDLQVGYLIDFVIRWKELSATDQQRLLDDPWELRDFADDTGRDVREMRHVLLHLLHPEHYERIASGSQKRQIRAAFENLIKDGAGTDDVDEDLYAIRQRLHEYLPQGNTSEGEIDFYAPPLRDVWDSSGGGEGVADLDALAWKKQVILYGPPGTSKTYQARSLAMSLIRREGMRRWGPASYFEHLDDLDRLVEDNIFWVQLHPGYSYEEFIRGLRLDGARTRYQPGLLFEVIARHNDQEVPEGLDPLPVVLVLDEINRTDMSRMLGEAFSLLERDQRGTERVLPGIDTDDEPMRLAIPEDVFFIGTMNEIDQSVETLDFALRRRFLWSECPFERDLLLHIIQDRWPRDVGESRFRYEDAEPQIEDLGDRAAELNAAINASPELGSQYEVGHTYFADITFFVGEWASGRKQKPRNGTYLWTGTGKPQPPLVELWHRSLKPLLEQYLAGSDRRDEEVESLRRIFFGS